MIVKSDDNNIFLSAGYIIYFFILEITCFNLANISFMFSAIFSIVLNTYFLLHLISTYKKFVFSLEGVEVSFWFYKRFYSYEELKFIRLENYRKYFFTLDGRTSPPYARCIKFSKKKIKNSKLKNPNFFYGTFHPFLIYVNFLDESVKEEDLIKYNPTLFTYNEKEFMDNMRKWNVKIVEDL